MKIQERLGQEDMDLQSKAKRDMLTGLYSHNAMELLAEEWLCRRHTGTLFVVDLDCFKQLNDRYGHITGDQILKKVGYVLTKMFPVDSIIGRAGIDKFAVLLKAEMQEKEIGERCSQLRQRFRTVVLHDNLRIDLGITVSGTPYRKGDRYRDMFNRLNQKIRKEKSLQSGGKKEVVKCKDDMKDEIDRDMKLIAADMHRKSDQEDTYCQDYEIFKVICRFNENKMLREHAKVFLLLFSLTDSRKPGKNGDESDICTLENRDLQMTVLKEIIQDHLHAGDLFTQYSSFQYLVMVSDLTAENIDAFAEQICQTFCQKQRGSLCDAVLYYSYPLYAI